MSEERVLYININDLLNAIEFQKKHDRFYEYYLGDQTNDAISGLVHAGFVRAVLVPKDREPKYNPKKALKESRKDLS